MKTASLDLGSNSFLCLISEKTESGLEVFEDMSIITRLGQSVQKESKLSKESLVRAAQAFSVFQDKIQEHQVEKIRAVTTAAAREATNYQELVDLGAQYGIPIEVISGEEEALLSFKGAVPKDRRHESLLVDIGGGSTEMAFREGKKLELQSLPLGAVRVGELFIENWADLKVEALNKAEAHIKKAVDISWENKKLPEKDWIAVAGTPTTLMAILNGGFEEDKINLKTLTKDQVDQLYQKLIGLSLAERRKVPGLPPKRADVIPVGTLILKSLMEWGGKTEVIVSTRGLRYGIAKSFTS